MGDGDPEVAVNKDGRLELFARFHDNLDLWQMYQQNPKDPTDWSVPRESSCVDQNQTTSKWYCLQPKSTQYWNTQPVFPTSDVNLLVSPVDGRLQLFYRGFDGRMYMSQQANTGNSTHYEPAIVVSANV